MTSTAWDLEKVQALMAQPFFELIHEAYTVHKQHFAVGDMEFCTLASIKTGACPEDCSYCPQSAHYNTGLKKEKLLDIATVLAQAKVAKAKGAQRFCMGAAWRGPSKRDLPKVLEMIREVKKLGLETCVSLGLLTDDDARDLKAAGLDFYNHNLDSSAEFYEKIIQTRQYEERLTTLKHVIAHDIHVCCGGIVGMGETRDDRIKMLLTLKELAVAPKSIPINLLIPIPGTPLEHAEPIDPFELIKMIAVTRILFPSAMVRLSAGRENMSPQTQAWCFMAGANSIFIGDKLLTAKNPELDSDYALLAALNMKIPTKEAYACE